MKKTFNLLFCTLIFSFLSAYADDNSVIASFDFEDGSLNDWTILNQGDGIQITQEDKYAGSYSVKLVAGTSATEYWSLQLETPQITTKSSHLYRISFWAKALGGDGIIRLSTAAANQLTDENSSADRQYLPDLNITSDWAQYSYENVYGSKLKAAGSLLQLRFDAGKVGGKTYYIDNIEIEDLSPDLDDEEPNNTNPLARDHSKFLGNIIANSVDSNFDSYWNQVTSENGGKWGSVEGQRDVMNWAAADIAYNHAKSKGYKYRYHTLVWGSQEPSWITSIPQNEQKEEIEEFMQAVATRYPDIDFIDVVNEPLHAPSSIRQALGGDGESGWDWVLWSFRKAREYFPNAKLHINDYGIISDESAARRYVEIVEILKQENLIDAVCIQCHEFNVNYVSVATMRNVLEILASTNLPIYVTELDISGVPAGNEESQYQLYREKFPVLWQHESVAGVTLWGYITGSTWKEGTGIVAQNGNERKATKWLRSYMASEESKVPNKFDETAVRNADISHLSIYPNPAEDYLILSGVTVRQVRIYDMLGRESLLTVDNSVIDIRSLEKGLYLLSIESEGRKITERFLKK